MTLAQRLTLECLRKSVEACNRFPAQVMTTDYGTGGAILAVLTIDNPEPNPIVGLWQDGVCHVVESEEDATRWRNSLEPGYVVQREDDDTWIIELGGSYRRFGLPSAAYLKHVDGWA